MERKRALEGVKVLDFSWVFTGPITTKFLGDHGAEIIKVESSARPDDTRAYAPYGGNTPGINRSAIFANYNSSKLGLSLNLHNPRGAELAKKLVRRSDVVLEAFSPGTMKRWGLHYEELRKIKPDIIMLSMTMQGQWGPFAQQSTFGAFFQSTMGFTDLLGWPDRSPCIPPTPYPDFISPIFLLIAILSALDYRRRAGKGQYLDHAQLESGVHFLTPALLDYRINGRVATRQGNRSPRAAPHAVYRCRGEDRWCAIAVFTDEEWQAFCRAIGGPAWTREERFSTLMGRKQHEEEMDRLVEGWTAQRTPEEVMSQLQAAGVAAGVVQNGEDLLDRDPQLKHRGHSQWLQHAEMGPHVSEMAPFRLSRTPGEIQRSAPCLGEHNEYVCKQILGLSDEEFLGLLAEGAFG